MYLEVSTNIVVIHGVTVIQFLCTKLTAIGSHNVEMAPDKVEMAPDKAQIGTESNFNARDIGLSDALSRPISISDVDVYSQVFRLYLVSLHFRLYGKDNKLNAKCTGAKVENKQHRDVVYRTYSTETMTTRVSEHSRNKASSFEATTTFAIYVI